MAQTSNIMKVKASVPQVKKNVYNVEDQLDFCIFKKVYYEHSEVNFSFFISI